MMLNTEFARLFKKYRLFSEIETLKEFGDLLAIEGIVYENTIFTRWQKGERYPRERKVLLKIIEVFAKRGGIRGIDEANTFLEAAKLRDLTEIEADSIRSYIAPINTATLPKETSTYIGRENILKEITWELLNRKQVLLYGFPGTGKTATAIHIAHLLKEKFTDGIYWFRADMKSIETIIDELLKTFQKTPILYMNFEEKSNKLNEIMELRKVLLIFDNLENKEEKHTFIANLKCSVIVTTIQKPIGPNTLKCIPMTVFAPEEYLELAERILSKPYLYTHFSDVKEIGHILNHIPILSIMLLKQIAVEPLRLGVFLNTIRNGNIDYKKIMYDQKNLDHSFALLINNISSNARSLLFTCAAFMGADISIKALSSASNTSPSRTKDLLQTLLNLSLIEASVTNRYRLHPALKSYLLHSYDLKARIDSIRVTFEKEIDNLGLNDKSLMKYLSMEFENISGMIHYYYQKKMYEKVIQCWNMVNHYLFTSGQWGYFKMIAKIIEQSYLRSNNMGGLAYFYTEDIGRIHYFQDKNNIMTIKYAKKGLAIARTIRNSILTSLAKQKLGIVAIEDDNFDEAIKLLSESNKVFKKENKYNEYIFGRIYLSFAYKKIKCYNKALRCLQPFTQTKSMPDELYAVGLILLGDLSLLNNDIIQAKVFFTKAHQILISGTHQIGLAMALVGIAKVYKRMGKNTQSIVYINKAKDIYTKLEMNRKKKSMWSEFLTME